MCFLLEAAGGGKLEGGWAAFMFLCPLSLSPHVAKIHAAIRPSCNVGDRHGKQAPLPPITVL
jgi:hypothetical protein